MHKNRQQRRTGYQPQRPGPPPKSVAQPRGEKKRGHDEKWPDDEVIDLLHVRMAGDLLRRDTIQTVAAKEGKREPENNCDTSDDVRCSHTCSLSDWLMSAMGRKRTLDETGPRKV